MNIFNKDKIDQETQEAKNDLVANTDRDLQESLLQQKIDDKKRQRQLQLWVFIVTCGVLLWLICLIERRFCGLSEIISIYKEKNNSDILWFYGLSIFSLMVTFLSIVLALMNIFAFKKKKYKKYQGNSKKRRVKKIKLNI